MFDWIFFIRSSNKDKHKSLDEFEILQDPAKAYELAALEGLEISHRLIMVEML